MRVETGKAKLLHTMCYQFFREAGFDVLILPGRQMHRPIRRDALDHVDVVAWTSLALTSSPTRHDMSTNHLRHAQQRLRQIAAEWPADPLRPNLQLKTFLSALADHPALTANAVAATNALQKNQVSRRVSGLFFDDFAAVKIK